MILLNYHRRQIKEKEDKQYLQKNAIIEEGLAIKRKKDIYRHNMEMIKQEKLKEMTDLRLKDEYVNELKRLKVEKY